MAGLLYCARFLSLNGPWRQTDGRWRQPPEGTFFAGVHGTPPFNITNTGQFKKRKYFCKKRD
jgi:hypothetical protein